MMLGIPRRKIINRLNTSSRLWQIGAGFLISAMIAPTTLAEPLAQQREHYQQAQQALDKKDNPRFEQLRAKLDAYPLTPYLDYRVFKQRLAQQTPNEVEQFITQHQGMPFSKRLRAPYLDVLYRRQDWSTILQFQTVEPVGERYQCIYYTALAKQGKLTPAYQGAKTLWLSGQSVASECDQLFTLWEQAGLRSDALILQRMLLAFEARNGSLVSYLSRLPTSTVAKQQAQAMVKLQRQPHTVESFARQQMATDLSRQQSALALKHWARNDVEQAQQALSRVAQRLKWPERLRQEVAESMAWRLFQTDNSQLAAWRDGVISQSEQDDLLERRVRLALQEANWGGVMTWIAQLSPEQQQSLRWQYWQARAEIALGSTQKGQQRLQAILGQRNFYSVAAAQELGVPYRYPVMQHEIDAAAIEKYQAAFVRIDELIALDKIAAAKSEWRHTLRRASQPERESLAVYAAGQRWHHLTVKASIAAKMWGNLQIRFPLAHRWWFDFYAKKHQIDPITLIALARQESALDVEARSPVGARGIMQIMPKTASYTARKYAIPYQGSKQLYDVGKNIEIGSQYLKGLLDQYDNNRIFALAAYNAGPHRVKTWRARTQGKVDAIAFIEAIPFRETRGYVQNILMFETYYRHLLDENGAFLKQHELNRRY